MRTVAETGQPCDNEKMTYSSTSKHRLKRFLALKEIFMMMLVALNLALLAYEHFAEPPLDQMIFIEAFDIVTAIVFLAEFIFEWHWAKDRSLYFRHHWFYLLAAVPVPSTTFELLRGVRALRLLKLLKIFAHMRYERNTRLFEVARQADK